MNAYTVAALVEVYVAAVVPWMFVAFYHVLSRGAWRRDPMGWHIMTLTAVDGAIFTMVLASSWWPAVSLYQWWQWAGLVVVAGIPLVTVWRGYFLWRAYHPTERRGS